MYLVCHPPQSWSLELEETYLLSFTLSALQGLLLLRKDGPVPIDRPVSEQMSLVMLLD